MRLTRRNAPSKKLKSGFTMVEVSVFLALSGVVLVGVLVSVSGSVSSQRFSDSAQETTEFLRSVYSSTINPMNSTDATAAGLSCSNTATSSASQAIGKGQSTCAIYGTLIVFGENNSTTIKTYQVVGNINVASNAGLADLNLQVVTEPVADEYTPVWDATIEKTGRSNLGTLYQGQVLIIRLPSGVIQTYFSDNTSVKDFDVEGFETEGPNDGNLDLCLNSPDATAGQRYDIRIAQNGKNTSAVQIVALSDSEDNLCSK